VRLQKADALGVKESSRSASRLQPGTSGERQEISDQSRAIGMRVTDHHTVRVSSPDR
jgi:hypothetical protein